MNPSAPQQGQAAEEQYFPPPPPPPPPAASGVAQGYVVPMDQRNAPPLPTRPHHEVSPVAEMSSTNPGPVPAHLGYPAPLQQSQPYKPTYDQPTYAAGGQQRFVPPPPPQRIGHSYGDDDPANPVHYMRDPRKLIAYLVPFPKPHIKGVDPAAIPDRFLVSLSPT